MLRKFLFAGVIALFVCPSADAGFMEYTADEPSVYPGLPSGAALAARNSFLAALSGGVGTETFEGFAINTSTPLNLSFPGSTGNIVATLSGAGAVRPSFSQRYNTTSGGDRYFDTGGGGDFTVNFTTPISAFGFYGTDIGDQGGNLVLTLSNGAQRVVTLPTAGSSDGELLFYGFTDDTSSYSQIAFTNTAGGDFFGFDDMTVGDAGQIVNPSVPEPASLAIFGVIGVAAACRRRRKSKQA